MTKKEVDRSFRIVCMPRIKQLEARFKQGRVTRDKPLRCEEYNMMLASMHRYNLITDAQASTYCIPGWYVL